MKYKQLGNSGLRVSQIVLGTMTFGDGADRKMSERLFAKACERGINLFDCADLYAGGESEKILGALVADRRHELLITSKAYFPRSKNPNDRGNSRLHLTRSLHKSLERLGTDYIDIYFLHRFDEHVRLDESLRCLDDFVRAGKIRYIGFSNFAAWQAMKALSLQRSMNLNEAIVIQPMYNLLKRQAEVEILPLAASESLGVLSYSPLAAGLLTGKYLQGSEGRLQTDKKYKTRYSDHKTEQIQAFVDIAKKNQIAPCTLALSWVMANPNLSAPIIGARTLEQLNPSLDALDFELSPDLYNEISAIVAPPPLATDREEERFASAFSWI